MSDQLNLLDALAVPAAGPGYEDDDLVLAGFVRWTRADGSSPAYSDPFNPHGGLTDAPLLPPAAARVLLRVRTRKAQPGFREQLRTDDRRHEADEWSGGEWRDRLPRGSASAAGAWHHARAWTGGLWIPQMRIVNPSGVEVWRSPDGSRHLDGLPGFVLPPVREC